ncbi:MAG: T9SS type A sorting domain-containing protein [Bacteroidetes bacterium]|nr:T9SS type A sorting domain-containing protein [Bacteroidota bacterium]
MVIISDITGKTVLKQVGEKDTQIDIQVASLQKGIYFLEVQNGKTSTRKRMTRK